METDNRIESRFVKKAENRMKNQLVCIEAKRINRNRHRYFIVSLLICVMILAGCGLHAEEHAADGNAVSTAVQEQKYTETLTAQSEAGDATEASASLQLIMVGDVLLHTPVSDSGKLPDGSYHYDHLFSHVKEQIQAADIAIANEEVILGGTELGLSGYPCFNGAYEVGDALADSGFDVILHATNHALDKGEKGVRNCLAYWKTSHPDMQITGINASREEQDTHITVIEKKGMKIAFLNYTYGTNGIELPSNAPYLVNLIDRDKIASDVEKARKQSDFVVVCPHWGIEYQHTESREQEELAQYLSDLGVGLIIGTHPHVIQPMKWLEGRNGNRTLVYYSLGNFVNATSGVGEGVADRMLGAMAVVELQRDENEDVQIIRETAEPLVSHLQSGLQKITVYPLSEYTQELETENEITVQDSNFSIAYLKKVWEQVMEP